MTCGIRWNMKVLQDWIQNAIQASSLHVSLSQWILCQSIRFNILMTMTGGKEKRVGRRGEVAKREYASRNYICTFFPNTLLSTYTNIACNFSYFSIWTNESLQKEKDKSKNLWFSSPFSSVFLNYHNNCWSLQSFYNSNALAYIILDYSIYFCEFASMKASMELLWN